MNYINLLMEGGSMEDLVNKADYIEKYMIMTGSC